MDLDLTFREFFTGAVLPGDALARLRPRLEAGPSQLERLADRFRIEATACGVARLRFGRGRDHASAGGHRHLEQARAELAEYLGGRRSFFSVPIDLAGLPPFQARVLAATRQIPFGEVTSYATLATRICHPRAARAVGNALGANPVPLLVPCHRVIRGDGTWGHYAFGGALKTRLLALERATPMLVGSATTRIVCRRGCAHERRLSEDRRIVFASVADAAGVGYRPCRVCRPARLA
jgi:O-6-methylguanine DNA methyltransferase